MQNNSLNCSLYNVCILENSRFHENSSFAKMQNNSLNCTLYNVCILENSRFHENSSLQKCETILLIALCIMFAFWRFSKWWLKWVTLQFSLLFPNVIHIFKKCLDSVVAVDKF